MAGALIALVVVVLASRLLPAHLGNASRYAGVMHFWRALFRHLGASGHAGWALLSAVGLPMLVTAALAERLEARAPPLFALAFDIAVLLYAWGPRDLGRDVHAVADATDRPARREAASHLFDAHRPVSLDGAVLVEAVFLSALRRWFGVAFWFVLLGPAGALGYRLLACMANTAVRDGLPTGWMQVAARALAWVEWPVAQQLTLALALVADFSVVRHAWRAAGGAALGPDIDFVGAAARAAVRTELSGEAEDAALDSLDGSGPPPVPAPLRGMPELLDALSLASRCLLVWLGVLAAFVVAGWVA